MGQKREQLRRDKEQKILAAAQLLFLSRGYRNITFRDIADQAGFTRRTVYAYFPTKEELMMTLHLEGLQKRLVVLEKAMAPAQTGLAKVDAFGRAYFRHYQAHPDQLLLQVILDTEKLDHAKISPALMSRFRQANDLGHEQLEGALALGKSDGTISPDINVKLYFVYLVFTLRAIAKQTLFPALLPVERFGEKFYYDYLKLLLKALAPDESKI
ncbi:MAG: TetR/AcrR family transcriptional regulator [Candidatus Edwardsbacteria bacterium]|nr:TetR/AcrR family transcriptional regulator [Candidatus Edwardsbacteria bacterium]